MSYKKYNWEIVAHDYNSPYLRNYIWTKAFFKYKNLFNATRPALGMVAIDNNIEYVGDLKTWEMCHQDLKKIALRDLFFIEKIIDKTHLEGIKMNKWSETEIWNEDLKKTSNKKLIKLLEKFINWQSLEYALGVSLPILDFQGFSFVENHLRKYLKKNTSDQDYQEYYSVFTEPYRYSFAQVERLDLLRLASKYYSNKSWLKDITVLSWNEISYKYPGFAKNIKLHTKKHAWVYYVYNGPAFDEQKFLELLKITLQDKKTPEELILEIENKKLLNDKLKKQYIKKLKPNKFDLEILNLAGKLVWGKPRRKDYQSKTYYHIQKLVKEIGRRLHLSPDQVKSAPLSMIKKGLLNHKYVDVHFINQIRKMHVCLPNDNGKISLIVSNEALKFIKSIKSEKRKKITVKKVIKGDIANTGKAKGIVKIVNSQNDIKKMQYGDILVSTATTPSIILALKKASAIVTDEGGLTSHASIISRELNIPCVIGTKIATKIFKDGDKIEVDANQGLIRKIT